jgi:N4-(beta-N-acetylglucosaminyl)-L-asparaginase
MIFVSIVFIGLIVNAVRSNAVQSSKDIKQKNLVINTWGGPFANGTVAAFNALSAGKSALDAVEQGCMYCEEHQCDTTVGYGNHPDTAGFTSLDAMIMDGDSFDVGSVGYIRRYRKAISIARAVMTYTGHTMLVGDGAESFAAMMGFPREDTTTSQTKEGYDDWVNTNCQPNFYENIPEAKISCGPYVFDSLQSSGVGSGLEKRAPSKNTWQATKDNHDTIGIVTLDKQGSMACGTSTNGANHKVAGRIGDSPITGAGCYVNSGVGGAAATGDGDVMMRFLPSFAAVSWMEMGFSPKEACQRAFAPITKIFPSFAGGIVCVNKNGEYAGASNNMDFSFSVYEEGMEDVTIFTV